MEEKEGPQKDSGEVTSQEPIRPKIFDKVWFARCATLALACLRQGNPVNAEEALATNIEEMGFSTDFLNIRMEVHVEGGRKFDIVAFGSEADIAVLKVRLHGEEGLISPKSVAPEEYAGIVQGIRTAFEKIRNEKLDQNVRHDAVAEVKISDFVVPKNTQVH